jgi:hypothetical protein
MPQADNQVGWASRIGSISFVEMMRSTAIILNEALILAYQVFGRWRALAREPILGFLGQAGDVSEWRQLRTTRILSGIFWCVEGLNSFSSLARLHNPKTENAFGGETGRISIQMLSRWIPDLNVPIYYIADPPGMVTGVRQMVIGSGIVEEDIRAEEFYGFE